jgi:hypothetical protein
MEKMRVSIIVWLVAVGIVVLGTFTSASLAVAQGQGQNQVIVPHSTVEHPEDVGVRSHTNHVILVRPTRGGGGGGSGNTINSVETPGSLACIYALVNQTAGCPNAGASSPPSGNGGSATLPSGGSGTIAIVDAYDYPTASSDLDEFSQTFSLPRPCPPTGGSGCFNFSVVYASGSKPSLNCGWAQEAALDIEWAHAMAPHATIVLVEANSNSNSDLFTGVQVASGIVSGSGGKGEVSMSWGGSEGRTESTWDGYMTATGVTYFAASGDSGGKTIYPSTSPNVVSCGGTSIVRNSGAFVTEQGWSGSGGGASSYEPRPSWQNGIASIVGTKRGTPDLSFDADPYSGVWVYDTTPCSGMSGWMVFGGTSVATPSLAGIVNLAGKFSGGAEQSNIYSIYGSEYGIDFRDITSGSAGRFSAVKGWDFVTGVGSDLGLNGK